MKVFTESEIKALKKKSIVMPYFFSDINSEGSEYHSAMVLAQIVRKDGVPEKILIELYTAGKEGKKNLVFNLEK
jgi:hypothetical protein